MNPVTKKADVGIIVGRFQLPDFHIAHTELIQSVIDRHKDGKVIVFLGLGTVPCLENALDYEARRLMFAEHFPEVQTAYIMDCPNDDAQWAKNLDAQIRQLTGPNQSVVLYGGRDAFISHYGGKYECIELEQEHWVSATEIRNMCKNKVKGSSDFRHGVFWSYWQRFPAVYPTADIAVFKDDYTKILLARKPHETLFRFVGGFRDKRDATDEVGAMRELSEEVPNLLAAEITRRNYVASTTVDDPRYDGTRDCIATRLYATTYVGGTCEADDDIAETKWFDYSDDFNILQLVPEHRVLALSLAPWVRETRQYAKYLEWVETQKD